MPSMPLHPKHLKPVTSPGPKFGWGFRQHNALEAGAINLLPDNPLKTFAEKHLDAINIQSVRQDEDHRGPHHALNLERLDRDDFGTKPKRPKTEQVLDTFSAARYQTAADKMEATPIGEHPAIDTQRNVHLQIRQEYYQLVQTFTELNNKSPRFFGNKMKLARQLEEQIGALMHYVGDLHQPMHVTENYSWTLEQPITKAGSQTLIDAHLYLETVVLNNEYALEQWQKSLPSAELPGQLSKQELSDLLDRQIRKSHLEMFTMVAAGRGARKHTQPERYKPLLRQRLGKAAEYQLSQAAPVMATILHSAWLAGGSPDLSRLELSKTADKLVDRLSKRKSSRIKGWLQPLLPLGLQDISQRP